MTVNTQQLLAQAIALHQAGSLAEAQGLYRTILDHDRNNVQALSMLGLLHMQCGDWEGGIRLLNISIAVDPVQPDALSNLGYAQQSLEKFDDALASYDKAIALYPGHVSAYYNRGVTLSNLKRYCDAVASFKQAILLRPDHADSYVNLGNAYVSLKRYDEAIDSYRKALDLMPADPGVFNNIGLALTRLCRQQEALASFDRAIGLRPDYVDAHLNRADLLQDIGRYQEAQAGFDKVLSIQPDYPDIHCRRAQALQNQGMHDQALAVYRGVLADDPGNVNAIVNQGVIYLELGDSDQAVERFICALRLDPECVQAYYNLAMQGHYAQDQALLDQLCSLHARQDALPVEDRVYLNFAMGNALSGRGRYDEAFDAYQKANRLHHAEHGCDEVAADRILDESISFFTAELFEKCLKIGKSLPPPDLTRTPVFIVGMPRSGTTLIEQILSSHPAVEGAGELKTFDVVTAGVMLPERDAGEWEVALVRLRELGRSYLDQVWKLAPDAQCITDKMPGNFMYLGLLHLMMPQAKIVHAMRDPMDSCFSCYTQHFRDSHDYAYDLGTLGRYYRRYMKLMRHWHEVMPSGTICDVRYEDMVAEPEREVRRLLDYIGLPWDDGCLKFHQNNRAVQTASLIQVRKPIYSSSVARWKRYEKHLEPLLEIVAGDDAYRNAGAR